MSARPTVVVTRRLPERVEAALGELFDARLNREDRAFGADALREALRSADGVLCTVTDQMSADVLAVNPRRARILANFGVGYNHIDVDAAKAHALVVTNTPDVLTDDTADLAITLLLMVARRTGEGERHVRAGEWSGWRPTHMLGTKVTGKTLGVIGLGRIGRAVAERARHGFAMRILFHDPYPPPKAVLERIGAERRETIEDVLRESDFVSLHCPASPETHHLMNAERLALMKPGAFLVNSARGDVIDETALLDALRANRIAGAALDVHEHEPKVHPELRTMQNVVLLPHLGSATLETREAMGFRALENLKAFFAGVAPRDRVA